MSQMRAVQVVEGDTFGRLEDDDFLVTGTVVKISEFTIDVDFGDWVQRYPRSSVREAYFHFQRLICTGEEEGTMIRDYRLGVAA